jgi:hypothetical protein
MTLYRDRRSMRMSCELENGQVNQKFLWSTQSKPQATNRLRMVSDLSQDRKWSKTRISNSGLQVLVTGRNAYNVQTVTVCTTIVYEESRTTNDELATPDWLMKSFSVCDVIKCLKSPFHHYIHNEKIIAIASKHVTILQKCQLTIIRKSY